MSASASVNTLSYGFEDAANQHTTAIAAGQTLDVAGNFLLAGIVTAAVPTNVAITGAGTLTVDGTSFQVGQTSPTAGTPTNSLDMSGLGTLTANLGSGGIFRLGSNSSNGNGPQTTVKLAATSTITTDILGVGDRTGRGASTQTLKLGNVANTINSNIVAIGSTNGRGSGNLSFETSAGTLTLRAADGTAAVTTMNMVNNSFGHNGTHTATVDLTGHNVDAKIGALTMARRTGTGSAGSNATLSFNDGTLEVATVNMAVATNAGMTGPNTATINIGGGTATFGPITMATNSSGGATTGTLNFTGGGTTVNGDIIKGGGTTTATVAIKGGTLDMTAGSIGSLANPVTLNLESGTLKNVAQINGGGDITKTTSGTLTLAGINTYTGNTTVEQGILSVAIPNFADTSKLTIGTLVNPNAATLDLPSAGTDTVATLIINGIVQPAGKTYGSASSVFPVIPTSAITGPGTITVPPGPGTPYTNWAASFLPADVSNPAGDNDNDGLTNQQEFAFGLSPVNGSSVSPILVQLHKTNGTFTYQRRAGSGLTYKILTSVTLAANSWTEDAAATLGQIATPGGSNETVVVTVTGAPLTAPKFFVRVAAE